MLEQHKTKRVSSKFKSALRGALPHREQPVNGGISLQASLSPTAIFYPIIPMGYVRQTKADAWKKRAVVVRYHRYRDAVRSLGIELPTPYKMTFYMPTPQSWSRRRREAAHLKPHLQIPDKDNLEKAVLDALFGKDSHVWSGWVEKRWGHEPGILIAPLSSETQS